MQALSPISRTGRHSRLGLSALVLGAFMALGASAPASAQCFPEGYRPARPVQVGHPGYVRTNRNVIHRRQVGHRGYPQARKSFAILEYERGLYEGKNAGYSTGYQDALYCKPFCDIIHRNFRACDPNYIRAFQIGYAKSYRDGFCAGELELKRRTQVQHRHPHRHQTSRWSFNFRW